MVPLNHFFKLWHPIAARDLIFIKVCYLFTKALPSSFRIFPFRRYSSSKLYVFTNFFSNFHIFVTTSSYQVNIIIIFNQSLFLLLILIGYTNLKFLYITLSRVVLIS